MWYGDCADQPVYGCTNDEAINYNFDATQDDGSCVVIPTCGEGESAVVIETQGGDSLIDLGLWYSLYWDLTDAQGAHVDLVYDYSQLNCRQRTDVSKTDATTSSCTTTDGPTAKAA